MGRVLQKFLFQKGIEVGFECMNSSLSSLSPNSNQVISITFCYNFQGFLTLQSNQPKNLHDLYELGITMSSMEEHGECANICVHKYLEKSS